MEEVKKEKKVRKQKQKPTTISFEFAQNLEKHFMDVQKAYFDAHKKLYKFASDNDPEEIIFNNDNRDAVNAVLEEIQDTFTYQLHPILNWIATRYQMAVNMTAEYEKFIKNLENAGASRIDNESNIIRSTDIEAARNKSPLAR